MNDTKNKKEFERGYCDATNKKRPWHVKTSKTSKRYDLDKLSANYVKGYAQGYAQVIQKSENREIKDDLFAKGYSDGINNRQPIIRENSYVEGYCLAKADRAEHLIKSMLEKAGHASKYNPEKRLSLEEFIKNKRNIGKFAVHYELGPTRKDLETKLI